MEAVLLSTMGLVLISGLGFLFAKNTVRAVLWLVLAFVAVACVYFSFGSEFLGLIQVLVYVGAISILTLFALMLTEYKIPSVSNQLIEPIGLGLGIAALVAAVLCMSIATAFDAKHLDYESADLSVSQIGQVLLSEYVIPLEVLGILLTVALIAGVLIGAIGTRAQPWPSASGLNEEGIRKP